MGLFTWRGLVQEGSFEICIALAYDTHIEDMTIQTTIHQKMSALVWTLQQGDVHLIHPPRLMLVAGEAGVGGWINNHNHPLSSESRPMLLLSSLTLRPLHSLPAPYQTISDSQSFNNISR